MLAGSLGVSSDDSMLLAGWWTTTKRVTSRATSRVISATKDANIPVVSKVATAIRSGGQAVQETRTPDILPQYGTMPASTVQSTDNKNLLIAGGAVLALLFLVRR